MALTVKDVMQRLGYRRPDCVYTLIQNRLLTAHARCCRPGGKPRWIILEADLDAYLESIRRPAAMPASTPRPKTMPLTKRYIDRSLCID